MEVILTMICVVVVIILAYQTFIRPSKSEKYKPNLQHTHLGPLGTNGPTGPGGPKGPEGPPK